MILECPECTTQFNIDDALLLPNGRKVRCTSCKHVWKQMPIPEDETGDDDEFDALSNVVEDTQEDPNHDQDYDEEQNQEHNIDDQPSAFASHMEEDRDFFDEKPSTSQKSKAFFSRLLSPLRVFGGRGFVKVASFSCGAAICVLVLNTTFITNKDARLLSVPSLYNVYSYLGYNVTPAGQGLTFKNVKPIWENDNEDDEDFHLMIKGEVFNSTGSERHIPPIKVTALLKSGAKGDSFLHKIEPSVIKGGATQSFTIKLIGWPESTKEMTAEDVMLSFDVESLN